VQPEHDCCPDPSAGDAHTVEEFDKVDDPIALMLQARERSLLAALRYARRMFSMCFFCRAAYGVLVSVRWIPSNESAGVNWAKVRRQLLLVVYDCKAQWRVRVSLSLVHK
jgi:hypothetical protein